MKFLFTRPHPTADLLEAAGHEVVIVPVDNYQDDEPPGREYPLSALLKQHDPDVLMMPNLGGVFHAKNAVIKWLRIRGKTAVGFSGAKGYGKGAGCTMRPNNCSVFVTEDEATAMKNLGNGRTVHWTGSLEPLMRAIQDHRWPGNNYTRKSPRPYR